jgi:hypothetical protein
VSRVPGLLTKQPGTRCFHAPSHVHQLLSVAHSSRRRRGDDGRAALYGCCGQSRAEDPTWGVVVFRCTHLVKPLQVTCSLAVGRLGRKSEAVPRWHGIEGFL